MVGRVLGDVDRGAAVLATQRQTLEHAEGHQNQRRQNADLGIAREHADQHGCAAHDRNGHEEGVLAADHVTDAAEDHRAERAHGETSAVYGKRRQQLARRVARREEDRRQERRERRVEIEVVPLDDRARR